MRYQIQLKRTIYADFIIEAKSEEDALNKAFKKADIQPANLKGWEISHLEKMGDKMKDVTTTDLADFGSRERAMLVDILIAWREQGLPDDFHNEEVRPMMNRNSGCVFLTNSEYQCAMMNGSKLEIWHNCGNCGHEGFAEDCQLNEEGCNACNLTCEQIWDGVEPNARKTTDV